jgi:hypothetical protein
LYLTKVDSVPLCAFDYSLEVCAFYGPRYQPGSFELVDSESTRAVGLRLVWVRADDLEIRCVPQPDQRIASSDARMLASRHRFDAKKFLNSLNACRKIRRGIDEVVDP